MNTSLGLSVAFSLCVSVAACSGSNQEAPSDEENAGAIHAEQAADQTFKTKHVLLDKAAATTTAAESIGVKAWTVYFAEAFLAQNDATAAYALDADGDVKYAVIMTAGGDVSIIPFDKQGPIAGKDQKSVSAAAAASVTPDVTSKLLADLGGLQSRILAAQASDSACAGRVAALVIKSVVAAGAASAGGFAAFVTYIWVDTFAATWTLLTYLSTGATMGALAAPFVAVAVVSVKEAKATWQEAVVACGKK